MINCVNSIISLLEGNWSGQNTIMTRKNTKKNPANTEEGYESELEEHDYLKEIVHERQYSIQRYISVTFK